MVTISNGYTMRIGVFVCECGPNIAENVDIDAVIDAVANDAHVAVAERYKLLCSGAGKQWLAKKIAENDLTHLVLAACSPKEHETTFMEVAEAAGLNPYLIQMANIREQCAWITKEKAEATVKAIRMVKAAIRRVRYHHALEKRQVESDPDVLVIGGGIAGMTAAKRLASPARKVVLVEKEDTLGGAVRDHEYIFPTLASGPALIDALAAQLHADDAIEILTGAAVEEVLGFFGNFETKIRVGDTAEPIEREVGAIVVATGYANFGDKSPDAAAKLAHYDYGSNDEVLLAHEAERRLAEGAFVTANGETPSSVAIVHCAGRDAVGYCSEVCCQNAMKLARQILDQHPDTTVTELYYDLCLPETSAEAFYHETEERGVQFRWGTDAAIKARDGRTLVTYTGAGGDDEELEAELVILSTPMTNCTDAEPLADILAIDLDEHGFFQAEHEMLDPVATTTEGIYIVGCAHGPMTVPEAAVEAEAAAGRIMTSLIPGKLFEPEVRTSHIAASYCMGCKNCLNVCSYGAITFDERDHVAVVNEIICRGCGNCVAACPSGAISLKHFTYTQLYNEMLEAVR